MTEFRNAIVICDTEVAVFPEQFFVEGPKLNGGTLIQIIQTTIDNNYAVVKVLSLSGANLELSRGQYKCLLVHLRILSDTLYQILLAVKNDYRRLNVVLNDNFLRFATALKLGSRVKVNGRSFNKTHDIDCVVKYIGPCRQIGHGTFFGFVILDPQDAIPGRGGVTVKYLKVPPEMGFIRSIDILQNGGFDRMNSNPTDRLKGIGNLSQHSGSSSQYASKESLLSNNMDLDTNQNRRGNRQQYFRDRRDFNTPTSIRSAISPPAPLISGLLNPVHFHDSSTHLLDMDIPPANKINFVPCKSLDDNLIDLGNIIHNPLPSSNTNNFPNRGAGFATQRNPMPVFRQPQLPPPLMSIQLDAGFHNASNMADPFKHASESSEVSNLKNQIEALRKMVLTMKRAGNFPGNGNQVEASDPFNNIRNKKYTKCPLKTCVLNSRNPRNIYANSGTFWNGKTNCFTNSSYKTKCSDCADYKINCMFKEYVNPQLIEFNTVLADNGFDIQYATENNRNRTNIPKHDRNLILRNKAPEHCSQCNSFLVPLQGILLKCEHVFCRACLVAVVKATEGIKIKCPYVKGDFDCAQDLQTYEIMYLRTTPNMTRERDRASKPTLGISENRRIVATTSDTYYCKSPNCHGWIILDSNDDTKLFACPVCNKLNCRTCQAVHTGLTCKEFLRQEGRTDESQNEDGAVGLSLEWVCANCTVINLHSGLVCDVCEGKRDIETIADDDTAASEEDDDHYEKLLEWDDIDLIENDKEFECTLCIDIKEPGEGVRIHECLHQFCKICLEMWITASSSAAIPCPFYDDEYTCSGTLQDREIRSLVSSEAFEQYLDKSFRVAGSKMENSFQCKTINCKGFWIFDDDITMSICPLCLKMNCHQCQAIHLGMSCEEHKEQLFYQNDPAAAATKKMLDNEFASGAAMKCPSCTVVLYRTEGCSWVVCYVCKTEICWATKGPRWGPGGKGDTSGGCGCDWFNKKKCHVLCEYCH